MKCIYCGFEDTGVIDSRSIDDGKSIRRRRTCLACSKRFTTYERAEETPVYVVKRDKSREQFDKQKLINGLRKACEKRPVSLDDLEKIASNIDRVLQELHEKEISTHFIGEQVMDALRAIDEVAYVRFASVYRSFRDASEFAEELRRMKKLDDSK